MSITNIYHVCVKELSSYYIYNATMNTIVNIHSHGTVIAAPNLALATQSGRLRKRLFEEQVTVVFNGTLL